MPHVTMHTAERTEIEGKPFLAIRRASHDPETLELKRPMSGGLWVNLSTDRADADIVRDLTNAALAAIEFAQLAQAEIAAREAAPSPKGGSKGKRAAA